MPSWPAESADSLLLQILRYPEGDLLWQVPVRPGEYFRLRIHPLIGRNPRSRHFPGRGGRAFGHFGRALFVVWGGAGIAPAGDHFLRRRLHARHGEQASANSFFSGSAGFPIRKFWSGDTRIALTELAPGGSLHQHPNRKTIGHDISYGRNREDASARLREGEKARTGNSREVREDPHIRGIGRTRCSRSSPSRQVSTISITRMRIPFFALDHRALHWFFMSVLVFALYPLSKRHSPWHRMSMLDGVIP